ncbi:MAG: alpha/beta hydrolase [Polyangiaceae bacterium]
MFRLLGILLATFFETVRARGRRGPLRPSWNFQFEWVIAFLRRDFSESGNWPYERLRADVDRRPYPAKALKEVVLEDAEIAGIPALRVKPKGRSPRAGLLLFLHGGSYIFGSAKTSHRDLVTQLAAKTGVEVLALDYRLAPEHPYPAALEDVLAVLTALEARGEDLARVVIAGDSAGGNLALVAQLARRDRGKKQCGRAVLISPWLDLTSSRPSARANDACDYGQTSFLLRHARDFAGSVELADPRVSPINAELAGLAPVRVIAGTAERLFDESCEFVERARAKGVDVAIHQAVDMPHNPPVLAVYHAEAARALDETARFISEGLPS